MRGASSTVHFGTRGTLYTVLYHFCMTKWVVGGDIDLSRMSKRSGGEVRGRECWRSGVGTLPGRQPKREGGHPPKDIRMRAGRTVSLKERRRVTGHDGGSGMLKK